MDEIGDGVALIDGEASGYDQTAAETGLQVVNPLSKLEELISEALVRTLANIIVAAGLRSAVGHYMDNNQDIEDGVLITEDGSEVLAVPPKEIEEVEALCKRD